jgi:hypothetical protein
MWRTSVTSRIAANHRPVTAQRQRAVTASYAEIVIRHARIAQDAAIFTAYTAIDSSPSGEQSWRISGKA